MCFLKNESQPSPVYKICPPPTDPIIHVFIQSPALSLPSVLEL